MSVKLCALGHVETAHQSMQDVSLYRIEETGISGAAVEWKLICTFATLVLVWMSTTETASTVALKRKPLPVI